MGMLDDDHDDHDDFGVGVEESLNLDLNRAIVSSSQESSEVLENGRGFWNFPFSCESITRSSETDFSDGFVENMNEPLNKASGAQSRLCARGHWRPAEDTKLRELVALYGPQNWNLIAEKLEGRSGKIFKTHVNFHTLVRNSYSISLFWVMQGRAVDCDGLTN